MTELQVGQSPMIKEFEDPNLSSFTMTAKDPETGKYVTLKAWGGKKVPFHDWFRNLSALGAKRARKELATFTHIENMDHFFIDDAVIKRETALPTAFFSSEVNGDKYNVAARRIPKNIKVGDRVELQLWGCCSIVGVKRVNQNTIRIE